MSEEAMRQARQAIESVLHREGRAGTVQLSRWDPGLRRWRQIDPPSSDAVTEQAEADRSTGKTETRTVTCVIGKLIRKAFEQQMLNFAEELGLGCEIVEHPHLLSTQVAFDVTGRPSDIDEFDRYLRAEAHSTTTVDLGAVPFGLP
jgi:hypothetical protein